MEKVTSEQMEILLRNPYWGALCTEQALLAIGGERAKRFPAEVIPFAGVADDGADALGELHELLQPGESVYVTSDVAIALPGLVQTLEMPGLQMVYVPSREGLCEAETVRVERLSEANVPEMIALKAVAFPGYFGPKAAGLGDFFGVRVEDTLVAMAGERLKLPGMREISALCTHPEYTGRGYAAALLRHLLREHEQSGVRSFLHVVADNTRAIALYERLGFVRTRELVWRRIRRVEVE